MVTAGVPLAWLVCGAAEIEFGPENTAAVNRKVAISRNVRKDMAK